MSALLLVLTQALACLGFLLATPYLAIRALRRPGEMRDRLGRGRPAPGALWIHAASLGELEALRSLLRDPRAAGLEPFFVTVLSVSGHPRVAEVAPRAAWTGFAPLDLFFAVEPFLRAARPRGLLLLETELWPWTLAACRRRGIPVAVISGRLSSRKWGRARLLGPLLQPSLRGLAGVGAQSEADAARFRALGVGRIEVTGNLKYRLEPNVTESNERPRQDAVPDGSGVGGRHRRDTNGPLAEEAVSPCLVVLGSLRRGEETLLEAIPGSGTLFVIAPRHLREREAWIAACAARGVFAVPRSRISLAVPSLAEMRQPRIRDAFRADLMRTLRENCGRRPEGTAQEEAAGMPAGLLLDVHGELAAWYAASDLAFVGGTLVPIGGHNLFEPAREGVPVAFGPHTDGVADLAEPLLRTGGGTRVRNLDEFRTWVRSLTGSPAIREKAGRAALEAAREVAGGCDRTWNLLARFSWIPGPNAAPAPIPRTREVLPAGARDPGRKTP